MTLIFLLVDFTMNQISVERSHWVILLIIGTFYILFLIIFTKVNDWIYAVFKLESISSWILLFSLIPVGMLIHLMAYGLSECKYRICCPVKRNKERIGSGELNENN